MDSYLCLTTGRKVRYGREEDMVKLAAVVREQYPAPSRYKHGDKYDPEKHLPPIRRRAAEPARYALSEADVQRIIAAVLETEEMKYARSLMDGNVQGEDLPEQPQQYSRPRPEDVAREAAKLQRAGRWQPYDAIARTLDTERYARGVTPERVAATAERYMKRGIYKSYAEIEAELSK